MRKNVISFISALIVTITGSTSYMSFAADSTNDLELWKKFLKYDLCITDYDSLTEEEKKLCKFIFERERISFYVCLRARKTLAHDQNIGDRITLEQLENSYGILNMVQIFIRIVCRTYMIPHK